MTGGQDDDGAPRTDAAAGPTAEDAMARMASLSDSLWALAALGVALRDGTLVADRLPADDPVVEVLVRVGVVVAGDDGLELAPSFRPLLEATGPGAQFEAIVSNVRQAAHVLGVANGDTGGGAGAGWASQEDESLLAQGRSSAATAPILAGWVFPQLAGLSRALSAPGCRFLDVGVGVAALAAAMCELFPELSVVGLDVMPRAIELGRDVVAQHQVADRVDLRLLDVGRLDDVGSYDLAWLPAPFIPSATLDAALPRLLHALRPGGWLLLAMGRLEGDPLSVAVTIWRTGLFGGVVLPPEVAVEKLRTVGFADVEVLATPPTAPVLVAARRAP